MFCENCGKKIGEHDEYCDGCGAKQPVANDRISGSSPHIQAAANPYGAAPGTAPGAAYGAAPGAAMGAAPGAASGRQQQPYQPYNPATAYKDRTAEIMGVGQYLGTFILMSIPVLNLILILAWSFSKSVNPNKRNYARAILVLCIIAVALGVLLKDRLLELMPYAPLY